MIIAGDIGGTKARIGLFERTGNTVKVRVSERYTSKEFANLEEIIHRFLEQHGDTERTTIEAACFGLPGPVVHGRVKVTNLPWEVVQADIAKALGTPKVRLVNDLVSTAAAVPNLGTDSLIPLYEGKGNVVRSGSCAVIAPGTGLGQALIYREELSVALLASEGGHANFAPSNDEEIELLKYLQQRLPHVSVESILCGPGLVNVYSFLRDTGRGVESPALAAALENEDKAAVITRTALDGSEPICLAAIDLFCHMLGAHCSNMVLNYLATGGIFLGGGIPPRIATALTRGPFLAGFLKKGKCLNRVEATPVFVIKDDSASLFGAAHIASTL